jgi:hypothetical protein
MTQDDENCIIDMEAADDGVDAQMAKCLLQTLQPVSQPDIIISTLVEQAKYDHFHPAFSLLNNV